MPPPEQDRTLRGLCPKEDVKDQMGALLMIFTNLSVARLGGRQ
jgi:hypothetical protein